MSLLPANNVLFGFLGGFAASILLRLAAHYGYTVDPEIVKDLPFGCALLIAHICDVITGDNKPPAQHAAPVGQTTSSQ